MRVIATKLGFYGQLRYEGDEFDVPKGSKATWFKPVKGAADAAANVPTEPNQGAPAATDDPASGLT